VARLFTFDRGGINRSLLVAEMVRQLH
jgi:hypothetical protein